MDVTTTWGRRRFSPWRRSTTNLKPNLGTYAEKYFILIYGVSASVFIIESSQSMVSASVK